jgi:hypothetical protein
VSGDDSSEVSGRVVVVGLGVDASGRDHVGGGGVRRKLQAVTDHLVTVNTREGGQGQPVRHGHRGRGAGGQRTSPKSRRRSDVDGVPDQVKGATISLVGTPAGGYIPMSVVPVIRCGEFDIRAGAGPSRAVHVPAPRSALLVCERLH